MEDNLKREHDPVNHPAHYTSGSIEVIDCIEAMITPVKNPAQAFLTGQVLKYLARYTMKNGVEDLRKAQWYLARLISKVEPTKRDDEEPCCDKPEVIRILAEYNGMSTVLDLLQEECAELVQAISKQRRYKNTIPADNLFEEMADVSILLDQLTALTTNGEARIRQERNKKIERTVMRYHIPVKEGKA